MAMGLFPLFPAHCSPLTTHFLPCSTAHCSTSSLLNSPQSTIIRLLPKGTSVMPVSIEAIENRLAQAKTSCDAIGALNDLAWGLRYAEAARAMALAQRAVSLSCSGEYSTQPHQPGKAASLVNMAFRNHQDGR